MKQDLFISYYRRWRLAFLISACCFLYLLKFTWLKWGDLIIDTGREAYVPLQLASGKLLYRDIFYLYGPFPPYFNAALFKMFGAGINTLVFSGALVTCFCSILIYKISRFFLDVFASTLVVATFLFVFAFGHYYYAGIFNFILPYSYPSTHAILFSLGALYFFYRWIKRGAGIYSCICSLCVFLALLSKIEIGIAMLLAIFIGISIDNRKDKAIAMSIFLAIPVLAAFIIYYLFFILSKGALAGSNLLDTFSSNVSYGSLFSRNLFSSGDFLKSGIVMVKTFLYYVVLSMFFISGGYLMGRAARLKKTFVKWPAYFLITGAIFLITYLAVRIFFTYELQYRALPLILLITAIHTRGRHIFLSVLSLFSLFLMARIFLKAWAGQFGFYLLAPGLIVYYLFFLKVVPDFLKQKKTKGFYRICFIFLSILFIISHFNISRFFYENRTIDISSDRGRMYVFNKDENYKHKQLMEFLAKNTGEKDTLVIFPEGIFINFLSKRENPLYYYQYLPIDLARESIENDIIKDMKNRKIDYIAINQRNISEYGYAAFGYDYGKNIYSYIINNYARYKQFGPLSFTSREYSIALFKRKI